MKGTPVAKYHVFVSYQNLDVEDFDVMEMVLEHAPDAAVSKVDSKTVVSSELEAPCAQDAVEILVQALRRAVPAARPLSVQLQLQSISEIAAGVGLNREAVRLWTTGRRGPGDFPAPIDAVGGDRTKVWAARDVWDWLEHNELPHDEARPLSIAETVDATRAIDRLWRRWHNQPTLVDAAHWRTVKTDETVVQVRGTTRRATAI